MEDLGFEASGKGEHVFLLVEKRDTNTDWLAGELARFAGIKRSAVSYAGLKDRHALTQQTFSLHLPGKAEPNWSHFDDPNVRIISSDRNDRKIRRGALVGNRFVITLRKLEGDPGLVEKRLQAIHKHGVPNYFGEQRFGVSGQNIEKAEAMFQGARFPRKIQGILTSAGRSHIFNLVLAQRVVQHSWNTIIAGEVCCLAGSRSWFLVDNHQAPELLQRVIEFDIHSSGPLWGRGEPPSRQDAAELETMLANQFPILLKGLEDKRLDHDRRPLRLCPDQLCWEWLPTQDLKLSFTLPAGAYATTVLRELVDWQSP